MVLNVVLMLHLCLLLGQVYFLAKTASDGLVYEAIGTDRVVSKHKEQVNHAHVGITDSFLAHRLLFKGFNQVLEAICALFLIVHPLFGHECNDHAAYIVLIGVLVGIVLDVGQDEVFRDSVVLVLGAQLGHVLDQFSHVALNARLVLPAVV